MKTAITGKLLRIFSGEEDRADGRCIAESSRKRMRPGLAGANVLRGIVRFAAAKNT